ncbi:regulatory-associated protein of TOR 1-like [Cucumis melo var. makuwa]|uniref:Regulatory-associated protein of TOR 1-like n=1 Tax=Cucumis melo var. makuwa TaxID=1194695 RepID=A0A5A7VAL0_CUCMM|nr:regulatory-associated protein of TOR 1-like [Cucumis melo var. makuwa]
MQDFDSCIGANSLRRVFAWNNIKVNRRIVHSNWVRPLEQIWPLIVAGTTTTIVPRAQLVPATTAVTPHILQTLMLLWGFLLWGCRRKECLACENKNAALESSSSSSTLFWAIWFCKRSLLRESLDDSLIDKIPGRQTDRKTLLGELNWIFTAVTDTIAWNVHPHDLFQRLFRQDLLVASLFRNFLLAEWIMRSANCSPISHPMLPPTHQHHMWDAWDMAAEICLSQLPALVEDPNLEFQVLLSQGHRFRALVLLGRFLDMGPWAVDLALSVGIFPYVLKLLQTTTPELRQILVFIWTMILALDKSASQVHGGLLAAGFFDGSVKLYDARIPELLVCTMRPHVQKVEKVVGIGFQPGLDSSKVIKLLGCDQYLNNMVSYVM